MKRNKGITLIALVITIIVLLILAGVAIAMLSGENGILKKAAEAKTKTEKAQLDEQAKLADYDIDGYFAEKGYKYKCRYGYITGVTVKDAIIEDTVGTLKSYLPKGYTVSGEGITDDTILYTGLEVKNGEETVAKVVVYGDTSCDGRIRTNDSTAILQFINPTFDRVFTDCQKIAADVNHDGIINQDDSNELLQYLAKNGKGVLENQSVYASNPEKLIIGE